MILGQLVGAMIFMLFGAMISGSKSKGKGSTRRARKIARGRFR